MQKERTLLYNDMKNDKVSSLQLSISDFPSEFSDVLVELKLADNNVNPISNTDSESVSNGSNVSILEI